MKSSRASGWYSPRAARTQRGRRRLAEHLYGEAAHPLVPVGASSGAPPRASPPGRRAPPSGTRGLIVSTEKLCGNAATDATGGASCAACAPRRSPGTAAATRLLTARCRRGPSSTSVGARRRAPWLARHPTRWRRCWRWHGRGRCRRRGSPTAAPSSPTMVAAAARPCRWPRRRRRQDGDRWRRRPRRTQREPRRRALVARAAERGMRRSGACRM